MTATHAMRPLGFGETLDAAFGVYRRHFLTLFATALVGLAPIVVLFWLAAPFMRPDVPPGGIPAGLGIVLAVLFVLVFVMMIVLWGALTQQAAQGMTDGGASVGSGLGAGFRSFFRLLGAIILAYFVVSAGMLALFLLIWAMIGIGALVLGMAGGGASTAVGVIIGLIGAGLGVGAMVIGFAWVASFFAIVPAVVIERKGPASAMSRSWQLAKGGRLRVVAVLVVTWIITILPTVAVSVGAGALGIIRPGAFIQPTAGEMAIQQVLNVAIGSLTWPFLAAVLVVLYFDRRVRTDAYDLETAVDALAPVP